MGEGLFGHPDDAEATVVGDGLAGAYRVDEFRRQRRADDDKLLLAPVEDRREAGSESQFMGYGKAVIDHDFFGLSGFGRPARTQVDAIEVLLRFVGKRNELSR